MQRFFVLFLGVFWLSLSVIAAEAQSQRMALPAGSYTVAGGGGGARVDAYCLDYHRGAPYGQMSAVIGAGAHQAIVTRSLDGSSLPLGEAINRGWVSLEGMGSATGLIASSLDGEDYTIEIAAPVAVSEQRDEFEEDIAGTLAWMASAGTGSMFSAQDVWSHRADAANLALGSDASYATSFSGFSDAQEALPALWEQRLQIDRANGGVIAYAHEKAGGDAFNRVVMAARTPVRRFSGADADRQIVQAYTAANSEMEIRITNAFGLEQVQPLRSYFERVNEEWGLAEWGSPEALEAEAQLGQGRSVLGAGLAAAQKGLLFAAGAQGSDRLTITTTPKVAATYGTVEKMTMSGGVIIGFDGGQPPSGATPGGVGGLPPTPRGRLTGLGEDEESRVAKAVQGESVWTLLAWSPRIIVSRLDSVMASAMSGLFGAVGRDASRDEVIEDVSDAVEFNRKAHETLLPIGEVTVELFLDNEETLSMRVALIDTPSGFRFVKLAMDVEAQ